MPHSVESKDSYMCLVSVWEKNENEKKRESGGPTQQQIFYSCQFLQHAGDKEWG